MAGLLLPRRWNFQPPTGARINWSHPLNQGLAQCYAFLEGGGQVIYDSAANLQTGGTGSPTWAGTRQGMGVTFNGSSQYFLANSQLTQANTPLTLAVWAIPASSVSTGSPLSVGSTSGYDVMLRQDSAGWNFWLHTGGDVAASWVSGVSVGATQHVVGVFETGGIPKIYGNGILQGTQSAVARARIGNQVAVGACRDTSLTQFFNGTVAFAAAWNRSLGPAEVERLYSDPWCMFETPRWWKWMGYTPTVTPIGGGRNFAVIIG